MQDRTANTDPDGIEEQQMVFDPRKAGEEADAMISKLNQVGDAPDAEDQGEVAGDDAIAAETSTEGDTGTDDPGADPEAPTSEDDQGADPEPASETHEPSPELATLSQQLDAANQRWRVLQGMIEKKDSELESMRALFAQLAETQNQQSATPATDAGTPSAAPAVTAEDIQEYGQDMVDFVKRVVQSAVQSELRTFSSTLDSKVGQLESEVKGVGETVARTAEERFEADLTAAVPDWEAINVSAAFLNWLNVRDEFSGAPRLQMLRQAYTDLDTRRVAKFFQAYKQEAGMLEPAPAAEAPQDTGKRRPTPASLVAPGKSKASAPKPTESGESWTRDRIAKLYDDKMKGAISAKDFDRLERDLFKAQHEGRVVA